MFKRATEPKDKNSFLRIFHEKWLYIFRSKWNDKYATMTYNIIEFK